MCERFRDAPSKNRFQKRIPVVFSGSPTMPRSWFTLRCFPLSGQKFRSARGVKAAHRAPKGFSLDAAGAGRSTMAARGKQHLRFHRLFRSRTFSRSLLSSRLSDNYFFSYSALGQSPVSRNFHISISRRQPALRFRPYGRACPHRSKRLSNHRVSLLWLKRTKTS